MTTLGHVRSRSTIGTYGLYFSKGIFFGVAGCGRHGWLSCHKGADGDRVRNRVGKMKNPPAVRRGVRASAKNAALALHKKKEACERRTSSSVCAPIAGVVNGVQTTRKLVNCHGSSRSMPSRSLPKTANRSLRSSTGPSRSAPRVHRSRGTCVGDLEHVAPRAGRRARRGLRSGCSIIQLTAAMIEPATCSVVAFWCGRIARASLDRQQRARPPRADTGGPSAARRARRAADDLVVQDALASAASPSCACAARARC